MDTKSYINELCNRLNWMQKDGKNDLEQWQNVLRVELSKLVQAGMEEASIKQRVSLQDLNESVYEARSNMEGCIKVLQMNTGIKEWFITITSTDGPNIRYFVKLNTMIGGIK